MVTAYVVARQPRLPDRAVPGLPARRRICSSIAVPGLLLIAIIFGGVRSGVFTATESSCIAVLYALLVTVFVYRQMSWDDFVHATLRRGAHHRDGAADHRHGRRLRLADGLPQGAAQRLIAWMNTISDNPLIILLLINV